MHSEPVFRQRKKKEESIKNEKKLCRPPPNKKKVEHKLLPRDPMTSSHSQADTRATPVELLLATLSHRFFPVFQLIVVVQYLHALSQKQLKNFLKNVSFPQSSLCASFFST